MLIGSDVERAIRQVLPDHPSLAAVAAILGISERTFQRRIAVSGHCFRQLLDQTLRQEAESMLTHSACPIAEVAHCLGYSDPAHFTRAFQRWTGQSPTLYRQSKL